MIPVQKGRTSPSEDLGKTLPKRGEEPLEKRKLPKHFWGDAVQMANQVTNRYMNTKSKSAWERLDRSKSKKKEHAFEKKVDLSIGGEQGIFLGSASQDGRTFKVLRLRNKKVSVTKNVTFEKRTELNKGKDIFSEMDVSAVGVQDRSN